MDFLRSARVALVEDDESHIELTQRAFRLRWPGLQMDVLRDGVEALEYFSEQPGVPFGRGRPIHLVLLDLRLPRVSGFEVLRRLKNDPTTVRLPVVVFTVVGERDDLEEALALGANGYVVKPMDSDRFQAAVEAIGNYWLLVNEIPAR